VSATISTRGGAIRCFILEASVNATPWQSVAEIKHACGRRRLARFSAAALLFAGGGYPDLSLRTKKPLEAVSRRAMIVDDQRIDFVPAGASSPLSL
jgi:hypothetical protein